MGIFAKFLTLALGGFLLLASCGSSSSSSSRIIEINFEAGDSPSSISCTPDEVAVLPGEAVRFRVRNSSPQKVEFIVTGQKGRLKYKESAYQIGFSNSQSGLLQASFQYEAAHSGHEEEEGPDATEDFPYRVLIDAGENEFVGVRTMLVTFPEIGEVAPDEVLEYFLCSSIPAPNIPTPDAPAPNSLGMLRDEGRIVRR